MSPFYRYRIGFLLLFQTNSGTSSVLSKHVEDSIFTILFLLLFLFISYVKTSRHADTFVLIITHGNLSVVMNYRNPFVRIKRARDRWVKRARDRWSKRACDLDVGTYARNVIGCTRTEFVNFGSKNNRKLFYYYCYFFYFTRFRFEPLTIRFRAGKFGTGFKILFVYAVFTLVVWSLLYTHVYESNFRVIVLYSSHEHSRIITRRFP